MNDVAAIAGQLMSYKTLADGTLRITIDLPEPETDHFHTLFPRVHCEVAVARMNPMALARAQDGKPPEDYGQYAQALWKSLFFGVPDVWAATGTDEHFLDFVRTQQCMARSGVPCEPKTPPSEAAHVWRLRAGFGKGIKGPYAAIPLCASHHRAQHNGGEDAIGGREYMEQSAYECRRRWIWAEIKDDIGVASMRDADPKKVRAWCERRNIAQYLPAAFKELT